jgi:hypothetical protein
MKLCYCTCCSPVWKQYIQPLHNPQEGPKMKSILVDFLHLPVTPEHIYQ